VLAPLQHYAAPRGHAQHRISSLISELLNTGVQAQHLVMHQHRWPLSYCTQLHARDQTCLSMLSLSWRYSSRTASRYRTQRRLDELLHIGSSYDSIRPASAADLSHQHGRLRPSTSYAPGNSRCTTGAHGQHAGQPQHSWRQARGSFNVLAPGWCPQYYLSFPYWQFPGAPAPCLSSYLASIECCSHSSTQHARMLSWSS
jgi:hypothetical protein